jgi:DNA-binding MarR family transcriptional regulator
VRSAWKSWAIWGSSGYVASLLLDVEYLDIETLTRRHLDVKGNLVNTWKMTRPRKPNEHDHVDTFLEEIGADLPTGLDLTVEGIVDRIGGINRRIKMMHEETLDQLDLNMSDWHVLTSLHWAGEPYRRKAGELARHADLTTGAMTSRLDALEKEGLIQRLRDPADRRTVVVELTEKGRQKHDQGMDIQAHKETMLARALTDSEKEELNTLLRRVLLTLEDRYPGRHG